MRNLCLLLAAAVLGGSGCGGQEISARPRDTTTPARALRGHWRDNRLWGWEEFFDENGKYTVTINRETFYQGDYEIVRQNGEERSLRMLMVSEKGSQGMSMRVEGTFSEDYKLFTGIREESVGGVPFSNPSPISWKYVDDQGQP